MAKALVLGSTGLVGAFILSTLRTSGSPQIASVEIIARRSPESSTESTVQLTECVEKDTSKWSSRISAISPAPSVMFSSLATTRAAAGGFQNQYKLEHDLNVELARAAKEAGTKTYVLISGGGGSLKAVSAYVKMKVDLEDHIKELYFEHTIIVRPGLLVGSRAEPRLAEGIFQGIANAFGRLHRSLKDSWAQDADVVAKAAVSAALQVERGEVKHKVWVLEQKDIVRLGSKEWKA